MFNRMVFLAVAGLSVGGGVSLCRAAAVVDRPAVHALDDQNKEAEKDEQKVAVDQLPAAVAAAMQKEVPGGTITEAEKEQKDGSTVYEMHMKSGNTAYEIKTGEDGKVISKEVDDDQGEKK